MTTDAETLLDLSKRVVDENQFKARLWSEKLLDASILASTQNTFEPLKIFKLTLTKLAEGWLRQRGNVFGFGDYNQNSTKLLLNIDPGVLDKAPINNMDAERRKGRINYELKIRGTRGLKSASSSNVKAQSYETVELNSDVLKEYRKLSSKTNELMKAWNETQNQLVYDGVFKKESKNLKIYKRRNYDLSKLKSLGGPFVSASEVEEYVTRVDMDPKQKDTGLYYEVRYARCQSLPKSSDIFRLKCAYTNLSLEEYWTNLNICIQKVETNASATQMDFLAALEKLLK